MLMVKGKVSKFHRCNYILQSVDFKLIKGSLFCVTVINSVDPLKEGLVVKDRLFPEASFIQLQESETFQQCIKLKRIQILWLTLQR